jgi:hypothetical protein
MQLTQQGQEGSMKVKGQYSTYRNKHGANYVRIPSFVEPAEEYELDVREDGTLVYQPVKP